MSEEKKSIFQGVLDVVRGQRVLADPKTQQLNQSQRLSGGAFTPSPANSMEDVQQQYLDWQVMKVATDIYARTLYFNADRVSSYADYDAMDQSPAISAALDIMRDECLTKDEYGQVLQIHSESERVKDALEDLFHNRLGINYSLRIIIRDMLKYGDYFLYLITNKDEGILNVQALPAREVHREEGFDERDPTASRFRWDGNNMYFEEWQIAHFRLMENSQKMPYGRCLKYDTYIETIDGPKFIKDIKKDDIVYSFDYNTGKKLESKVLDCVCSGEKSIIKIRTKNNEIEASEEHKIMVYNNGNFTYKSVSDLKIRDLLVINNKKFEGKEDIAVNKNINEGEKNFNGYRNKIIHVPDTFNEELAQFFGFMTGDGWVTTKNGVVCFALGIDDEVNEKYIYLLEKFSGVKSKKIINPNKQAKLEHCYVQVQSRMLKELMLANGFGGKSWEKRIPSWVFNSSESIKKAFIQGLIDSDGSLNVDKWGCKRYSFEVTSEYLVKDLKVLLQSINIKTGKICSRKRENSKIWGKNVIKKRSYYIYFYETELKQAESFYPNNTTDIIVQPIVSIEETEKNELVYDIHVENINHNFYANGIVVHNSVLDSARKTWKQLQLAMDAMLTYRITRAPDRRVFYVEVGTLDEADIKTYMQNIQRQVKKQPIVNQQNGNVNYRYDPMNITEDYFIPVKGDHHSKIDTLPGACLALDTKINLLDGRSLALSEIIKEYESGKELWSYSINPKTGEVVPGIITWAGVTRKNTDAVRLTLDNGETIVCTPDHKFDTKFNGEKEAKDLLGESLWSFNKDFCSIKKGNKNTYERVFDHSINEWVFTHRMVAKNIQLENYEYLTSGDKNTIHHKDFNRYSNIPSNLCWMNSKDHYKLHSDLFSKWSKLGAEYFSEKFKNDKSFRESVINRLNDARENFWKSLSEEEKQNLIEKRRNSVKEYFNSLSDEDLEKRKEVSRKNIQKAIGLLQERIKNDYSFKVDMYERAGKTQRKTKSTPEFKAAQSLRSKTQWQDDAFRSSVTKKQTIAYSPEMLQFVVGLYREDKNGKEILQAINAEGSIFMGEFRKLNESNKQLAKMKNGFTHNNLDKMMKNFGYKGWRDFTKKAIFFNHKVVSVEFLTEKMDTGTLTIDGNEIYNNFHNFALSVGVFTRNSNMSDIEDIEFLEKQLFSALKVPKPYLNYSENVPGGNSLSQSDIRFAKTINGFQEATVLELKKMAKVHLFFLGFHDDVNNFELTLNNPSTQLELMKLEIMKARLEVGKEWHDMNANSFASWTWVMENIHGFSKAQIKMMLRQKKIEKKLFAEIDSAAETYKKTGIFKDLDRKYEIDGGMDQVGGTKAADGEDGGGGFSASSALGNMDLGGEQMGGGDEGMGSGMDSGSPEPPSQSAETPAPSAAGDETQISESKKAMPKKKQSYDDIVDELMETIDESKKDLIGNSMISSGNDLSKKVDVMISRMNEKMGPMGVLTEADIINSSEVEVNVDNPLFDSYNTMSRKLLDMMNDANANLFEGTDDEIVDIEDNNHEQEEEPES